MLGGDYCPSGAPSSDSVEAARTASRKWLIAVASIRFAAFNRNAKSFVTSSPDR
jgi:hypothetical protein